MCLNFFNLYNINILSFLFVSFFRWQEYKKKLDFDSSKQIADHISPRYNLLIRENSNRENYWTIL